MLRCRCVHHLFLLHCTLPMLRCTTRGHDDRTVTRIRWPDLTDTVLLQYHIYSGHAADDRIGVQVGRALCTTWLTRSQFDLRCWACDNIDTERLFSGIEGEIK